LTPPPLKGRGSDDPAPTDPRAGSGPTDDARDPGAAGTARTADTAEIPALTPEEAIKSLIGAAPPGRDDLSQALGIIGRMIDRFGTRPSLRIGSVNVFNDEVLVEDGDFTIGGGGADRIDGRSRPVVAALTAEVLQRHIGAYVPPPGYGQARRILEHEHLVVLSASAGTGREACALALLNEVADPARLHLIGPDPRAAEHVWRSGARGGGYVASEVDPAAVTGFGGAWLRDAAKTLTDAGGYLVLVTGPAAAGGSVAAGSEFVVENLGRPDSMTVLRRRARTAARPGRASRLDGVLADAELAELLAEDKSPRFAARCAAALADAVNRGADPAEAVAALCDPAARVRAWFERMDGADPRSDQEIALAMATAVLDGCSYLTVTDAATALYDRLHRNVTKIRFRASLRSHQRWLDAHVPDCAASVHGDPTPEILRFRNPRVQATVLSYVWTELDGLRPALIAWLRDLADHADVDVRACAAASAGLLATLDFAYAVRHLLRPWATSSAQATRACAALALSVPIRDPRYAQRVWALLDEWANDHTGRNGNRLAWTAAEAVSSTSGDGPPEQALEVLHDVLERDDWDCLVAMSLGLLNLVETGHAARALVALLDWSEEQDESPKVVKALATFVTAARTPAAAQPPVIVAEEIAVAGMTGVTGVTAAAKASPSSRLIATNLDGSKRVISADRVPSAPVKHPVGAVARVPVKAGPSSAEPWPFLLREADKHRADLRDLWARALACTAVRPVALAGLRSWLDLVDRDPAALGRVGATVQAVCGLGGKHRDRLLYHLEQWAEHPQEPSAAAKRVLALISPDPF